MSDVVPGVRLGGATTGGHDHREVLDPATGEVVGVVAEAGADDVAAAVAAASAAQPGWAAAPPAERARRLRAAADALRAPDVTEELAVLASRETGKRLAEARAEVGFSAAFLDWFADAAATGVQEHRVAGGRRFLVGRRPLGVVAAVSPWNFPLSIPARKIGAALAAGCAVVNKPSELAPLSGLRFAEVLEPFLPDGALTTVTGDGARTTVPLIDDPRVAAVSFTGSTRVGVLVAARCAASLTRPLLELGGRAPFVVRADADLDAAVEVLAVAKYRNNGASCIAANNVFVHESRYEEFVAAFADRTLALRLGDPRADATDLGPVINGEHAARLAELVADARRRGARVWQGADVPATGHFVAPAVVAAAPDMPVWDQEVFGPVVGVRPFHDDDALAREINGWDFGLGGYVCGRDTAAALAFAERLQIGIVGINTGTPNTPEVPFGGFKHSGYGREGGVAGLHEFTEPQTLSIAL
ncbi:aldehyde dehydrogenase family protein [Actinomadura macrotermitis]|uniref:Glutarate-semialdehyde dehydrogenase DavD n=1 Tax=Actinomadura macrotermitis TaxID=2585200 RepID=A0A7K0BPQ2_9ACTN|nr:aldehyde dehydrogenase family protein [Actinomadura macrotermitis]MQY02684.1 Glutarate-semialdehyde dehydrogenase DavD [Actinomadura macrotermitis]